MKPQLVDPSPLVNWPQSLVDRELFQLEQARLARVWTFLGFAHDVANDGDWFRATLATRSVFVQRFGSELRGFENRCAHRSFPLRTADKGNGPVVCGFHHWRYDRDGRAIDIPECSQLFGAAPAELIARLNPVEIATCGSLVFGRFAAPGDDQTLEQFLGEGFEILRAMSSSRNAPQRLTRSVEANWRLCFHTSVDDYHPVAVHPSTFGKDGYPSLQKIGYFRFSSHSAFFSTPAQDALTRMAAECRQGVWRSADYRVFHIFPDLTIAHFRVHWENWYITVLQYSPVTEGQSTLRAWFYPAPFAAERAWYDGWTRPLTDLARRVAMSQLIGKVLGEDIAVCERLQSIACQQSAAPLLGALEERLAWFEEAYSETIRGS